MWSRKELKVSAKALLKANYWKVVVASLALTICSGAGSAASSRSASEQMDAETVLDALEIGEAFALLGALFAILAVVWFVNLLISLFVFNPLEIGAKKLLANCKDGSAKYGDIGYSFKNSYLNAVKTLFLRGLFTALWGILLVIPGIVKKYEYRMIPYLLAENPQMSSKEAFARSKEIMSGNKWKAFVWDLSFIGWHILGICTLGIVEIFFSAPYHDLANAQLYHELSK